jgi:hypothetical protein
MLNSGAKRLDSRNLQRGKIMVCASIRDVVTCSNTLIWQSNLYHCDIWDSEKITLSMAKEGSNRRYVSLKRSGLSAKEYGITSSLTAIHWNRPFKVRTRNRDEMGLFKTHKLFIALHQPVDGGEARSASWTVLDSDVAVCITGWLWLSHQATLFWLWYLVTRD